MTDAAERLYCVVSAKARLQVVVSVLDEARNDLECVRAGTAEVDRFVVDAALYDARAAYRAAKEALELVLAMVTGWNA